MASFLSAQQSEPSSVFQKFALKSYTPEPDGHRGRKRHRSLTRCELEGVNVGGTGESSTLRGRTRRRSTSQLDAASRTGSHSHVEPSVSPARKRLLRVLVLDRRRSQSPSRSRSPNNFQKSRRRQRTRSRSRSHGHGEEPTYRAGDQSTRLRQEVLRKQATRPLAKEAKD